MEDFRINGDMIISKALSDTDFDKHGRLQLPNSQIQLVLTKMKDETKKGLKKGIKLEVLDITKNNSYFVTLKSRNSSRDYYLETGWKNMRKSLGLKEGDNIKLYWDYLNYKFIILNFQYSLIP
ncbi:hypothetical protein CARUB_v10002458mg [Capsella rubella]|uniref:TF-B3 domain-containing protein n=1 Tax=Capsella rubella TaxID=81985 RepID=R0ETA4_9BRAS|nr:hypothetical protein CARUB_v10012735mg [Capsella rubella]EOA21959.1 hypothetical protein CARUB_v10002458mg [Capsella rubella]